MELLDYLTLNNKSHTHKKIASIIKNFEIQSKDLTLRYKEYEEHKHLMRNKNILFEDYFREASEKKDFLFAMEKFDDDVYSSIIKNKAKKLIHSVISNKYSHLITEQSTRIFETFVEEGIERKTIQDGLTKKIARIDNSWEFEEELNILADSLISWDKDSILNKIKERNLNVDIVLNDDNEMIVQIPSFKEAKALGSRMWCITQSDNYFNNYTSALEQFYFHFDFNKKATDTTSFCAYIVNRDETTKEGYLRNDDEIKKADVIAFNNKFKHLFKAPTEEYVLEKINIAINKDIPKKFTFGMFKDDSTSFFNNINQNVDIINVLTKEEQKQFFEKVFNKTHEIKKDFDEFSKNNIGGILRTNNFNLNYDNKVEIVFNNESVNKHLSENNKECDNFSKLLTIFSDSELKKHQFPIFEILYEKEIMSPDELVGVRNVVSQLQQNDAIDTFLLSKNIDFESKNDVRSINLSTMFREDNVEKHNEYIETIEHHYDNDIVNQVKSDVLGSKVGNYKTPIELFVDNEKFVNKAIVSNYFSNYLTSGFGESFNSDNIKDLLDSNTVKLKEIGRDLLKDKTMFLKSRKETVLKNELFHQKEFKDMLKSIDITDVLNYFDFATESHCVLFEKIKEDLNPSLKEDFNIHFNNPERYFELVDEKLLINNEKVKKFFDITDNRRKNSKKIS